MLPVHACRESEPAQQSVPPTPFTNEQVVLTNIHRYFGIATPAINTLMTRPTPQPCHHALTLAASYYSESGSVIFLILYPKKTHRYFSIYPIRKDAISFFNRAKYHLEIACNYSLRHGTYCLQS